MAWADEQDAGHVFWLVGMAGTGKSTISRTVARELHEQDRLGASFFFSRSKRDVGQASKFITSIAMQLASISPSLKEHICNAIKEHSDIASRGLRDQWNRLIIHPLSKMKANSVQSPLILVVDALDECEAEDGQQGKDDVRLILALFYEVKQLDPIRLKIFVTSRPEVPIYHGFSAVAQEFPRHLILHDISRTIVDQDISIFYREKFRAIGKEHSLSEEWPNENMIREMVEKTSGLFVYAATACRFIQNSRNVAYRLSLVLHGGIANQSPTQRLDEMYNRVLMLSMVDCCDEEETRWFVCHFRLIVGSIIVLYDTLTTQSLADLLKVSVVVIDQVLDPLRSFLDVPVSQEAPIRLHHPSFRDFLFDSQRCSNENLRVDEKNAHKMLATSCMQLMARCLRRDICALQHPAALASELESSRVNQYLPCNLQYACRYWATHFACSDIDLKCSNQIHRFLQEHLLHWLEVLSLIGKMAESVHMINTLRSTLSRCEPKVSDFLNPTIVLTILTWGNSAG